jgi:hypothetical protein
MGFSPRWTNVSGGSGDLDGNADGVTEGGTGVSTGNMALSSVSCLFVVDAETNTLTIEGKFQVSDDNTTWFDLAPAHNPANVVLATGTGGADPAISRVLDVPDSALGWRFVRAAVVSRVVAGNTADTYAFTFHFRKETGF